MPHFKSLPPMQIFAPHPSWQLFMTPNKIPSIQLTLSRQYYIFTFLLCPQYDSTLFQSHLQLYNFTLVQSYFWQSRSPTNPFSILPDSSALHRAANLDSNPKNRKSSAFTLQYLIRQSSIFLNPPSKPRSSPQQIWYSYSYLIQKHVIGL